MNFLISDQKIKTKKQINYLGIIIDEHLSSIKQNIAWASGIFARLRHYVQLRILQSVYFTLLDSHMKYFCQI